MSDTIVREVRAQFHIYAGRRPYEDSTKLGRAMYLLRHTQNHIGELNSDLERRGLPRGAW